MRIPMTLARFIVFALGTLAPLAVVAVPIGTPLQFSDEHADGDVYMNIRLRGALVLDKTEVDGYQARQLSALAWDADAGLLYALSDDGYLVHLSPRFTNGMLEGVDFMAAHPLREADGSPVRGDGADSEGLAIIGADNGVAGDTELLISFEVQPRLLRYTPDGELLETVELPEPLADAARYAGSNSGLEAVAVHPLHGVLVAPEARLTGDASDTLPIFALDGGEWRYQPLDARYSAIVGIEVTPEGDLTILERRYKSIFSAVIFSLRRLHMHEAPAGSAPPVSDIARFSNREGWRVDNFEGIARHRGNRWFIVSDDNRSAIQRTVLVYFEVLGDDAGP